MDRLLRCIMEVVNLGPLEAYWRHSALAWQARCKLLRAPPSHASHAELADGLHRRWHDSSKRRALLFNKLGSQNLGRRIGLTLSALHIAIVTGAMDPLDKSTSRTFVYGYVAVVLSLAP